MTPLCAVNILISPDKFKGSLTAGEAAAAIRRGFEEVMPAVHCRELPIADGGEGTTEILCAGLGGQWIAAACHDPLGQPVTANYAMLPGESAVLSMSAASGWWRVPRERRDPLRSSTFGTGELMADALRRGARKLFVGLGGSATNDGGIGMAAALGYEFVDPAGRTLESLPVHLGRLDHIRRNAASLPGPFPEIIALCDVDNPLLGAAGATRVYGPQKGVDPVSGARLEEGLARLAQVVARDLGCDHREVPGAGAAGGLGFGILSFCGGRLRSGFETVAEILDLPGAVAWCDLVVTGEGRLDAQTLAGKGPAGIAVLARTLGKPVVAFAGDIPDPRGTARLFDDAMALRAVDTPLAVAMRDAAALLQRRAAEFAATRLARVVAGNKAV